MFGSLFSLLIFGLIIWLIIYAANSSSKKDRNIYDRGYSEGYMAAMNLMKTQAGQKERSDTADSDSSASSATAPTPEQVSQPIQQETYATQEAEQQPSLVADTPEGLQNIDEIKVESRAEVQSPDIAISQVEPPDLQALKKANTMRNLNVLLGLSSLLFVAAGIAFIASPLSNIVKLLGVIFIMIIFYSGGMALYVLSQKLKPAAVAFIGTGLALMPFVAIALHEYGGVPSQWAWFMISITGVMAYGAAAIILQSQVVSYLTVGFLLSFVGSSLTVGSAGLIWYFASLIAFSLVLSVVSFLKPRWLPAIFGSPVALSGQLIAPMTLVASLLAVENLEIWHYELLTGLTALHYLVAWVQTKKSIFMHAARGLVQITAMLIWADIADGAMAMMATGWFVISIAHQLIVLAYVHFRKLRSQQDGRAQSELAWVVFQFIFQSIIQLAWLSDSSWVFYLIAFYSIWLLTGVLSARIFRASGFLVASVIASLVLPGLILQQMPGFSPPVWVLALTHSLLMGIGLALHCLVLKGFSMGWRVMGAIMVSLQGLTALGVLSSVDQSGPGLIVGVLVTALAIATSHVYKKQWLVLTLLLPIYFVGSFFANLVGLDGQSAAVMTTLVVMLLGYGITATYWVIKDDQRGVLTTGMANLLVIPFAISLLGPNIWLSAVASQTVSLVVLMFGITANLVAKLFTPEKLQSLRVVTTASYITFFLLGLLVASSLPAGWLAGLLALGVILAIELSYDSENPWLVLVANGLFYWLVSNALSWTELQSNWRFFVVAIIVGAALYGLHWLFWWLQDESRRKYTLASVWIVLLGSPVVLLFYHETRIAASILMLAGATTIAIDGLLMATRARVELAVYVGMAALSVMIYQIWPGADSLVHWHLWAVAVAMMAKWRKDLLGSNRAKRLVIAMSLLTLSVGFKAIADGGWYSLVFLVEHVSLLVVGALMNRSWAVKWGVITSVLAVVYYMRESPYVLFALLGAAIVGFVIWRLRRIK